MPWKQKPAEMTGFMFFKSTSTILFQNPIQIRKLTVSQCNPVKIRNPIIVLGYRPICISTQWFKIYKKKLVFLPEMITVPEWTPAGVWIFGRSQYFRFKPEQEPESTIRSMREPIKDFQGTY